MQLLFIMIRETQRRNMRTREIERESANSNRIHTESKWSIVIIVKGKVRAIEAVECLMRETVSLLNDFGM